MQNKVKSMEDRGWSDITFKINWEQEIVFYGKRLENDKELASRMKILEKKLKQIENNIEKQRSEYGKISEQLFE